eukprot:scaffold374377_cov31-Attheya_sp.AAC.1
MQTSGATYLGYFLANYPCERLLQASTTRQRHQQLSMQAQSQLTGYGHHYTSNLWVAVSHPLSTVLVTTDYHGQTYPTPMFSGTFYP